MVSDEVGMAVVVRWYFQCRATVLRGRGVLADTFIIVRFAVAQRRLIGELEIELQTQVVVPLDRHEGVGQHFDKAVVREGVGQDPSHQLAVGQAAATSRLAKN